MDVFHTLRAHLKVVLRGEGGQHNVFLKMEVVKARAKELSNALAGTLDAINSRSFKFIKPEKATVSTITITASLNTKKVCRDSMLIALSLVHGDGPLTAGNKKKNKRKLESEFFNQVTLHHGTKSIKVFNNGSMHVTGCTSPLQFLDVASAVCAMMTDVAGITTSVEDQTIQVTEFQVQMINVNFGAGRQLYLKGLQTKCTEMGYTASYDPDVYPGLNVKLPIGERRVTILMFKSGKVIITGVKTACELDTAHVMITSILDQEM